MKKLGFGLMRLPLIDKNDQKSIDIELMKKMVDMFISRGFTYFDTAYPYHSGQSERALRAAVVERYARDKFTVTDKMPCWETHTEADLERIFNEQLQRCGVDYFDYYLLHSLNKGYYSTMQRLKGFEFVERKKKEGLIKHVGFSFHDDPATLERILNDHPEAEFVQLQINYIDWNNPSVASKECYDLCVRHGKPIIVMEPVKGGSLAKVPDNVSRLFHESNPDMSVASWAIRYAASLPNVMMVLSGMSDMSQAEDNTAFMQEFKPINEHEAKVISEATEMLRKSIAIPCTACHYCTEGCPQHISIPEYFALVNTRKQFGKDDFNTSMYYELLNKTHGKASDCIECGQCEEHCPQHLPIIDDLKMVKEMFEKD
jgi:predicted aldo/keto reductase-like oxidoreductase